MTIQVVSNEPKQVEAPKAEVSEESKPAPVDNTTEQKEASESETEETEEKIDESKDESESEDNEESDDSEKDKPKKKGGFQRRIKSLTARNAAAQEEIDYWKQQALKGASETKKDPVEPVRSVTAEDKPNPDSFETHTEYVEALTDWKIEQREKVAKETEQQNQIKTEHKKTLQAHYDREKSFAEKTNDYKEVITDFLASNPKVSTAFEQLVVTSENGPEIMYMLAKDAKEFERINSLSPLAAAREIGKLESKLSTSEEKKPELKQITKAPNPIAPIGGKGASVSKSIDDPNLSQSEYERIRREQMKARSSSW